MSPITMLRRASPLALLLALAVPAAAQLQPLDGQWIKLHVKATGRTVDTDTLVLKKGSLSTTAFLHLALSPGDGTPAGITYDWQLWTKQDNKVWAQSDMGTITFIGIGGGDQIAVDLPLDLTLANGRSLSVRATLLFDLKVKKKNGLLKGVKVSTLGAEVVDGSVNGADEFRGGANLKGQDVAEGKLPFEP